MNDSTSKPIGTSFIETNNHLSSLKDTTLPAEKKLVEKQLTNESQRILLEIALEAVHSHDNIIDSDKVSILQAQVKNLEHTSQYSEENIDWDKIAVKMLERENIDTTS